MAFTPINTQEEFDNAIKDRLNREREKFSDYDAIKNELSELKGKGYEKQIADLNEKLKNSQADAEKIASLTKRAEDAERGLTRHKIASEFSLPSELVDRINGNTEEEIRKDAEALSKLIGSHKVAPLAHSEEDGSTNAYKQMLSALKK